MFIFLYFLCQGSTSEMPAFADSDSNRIVWVDCEMTGLDPDVDTLLEIAVIVTDGDLNLVAFKCFWEILFPLFEYYVTHFGTFFVLTSIILMMNLW